ncbi:MAG: AAA family ATPase, partial [Planctomycetaceae bacterium]|nr:AAA family ATPase [Planctomycetaceae bacterium]
MQLLPIGIQSFCDLRNNNYLYVDKTEDIYRMITSGKTFFLSRPRRFGKSLLLSTMEKIFSGNKELFEGLYIYDKWDWTQKHPVIKIDWSSIKHTTAEEMEISTLNYLKRIAARHQVVLSAQFASDCFDELLEILHVKTGMQVVVLVDEYDMP